MRQAVVFVLALVLGGFIGTQITTRRFARRLAESAQQQQLTTSPQDIPHQFGPTAAPPIEVIPSPVVEHVIPQTSKEERARSLLASLRAAIGTNTGERSVQQRRIISLLDQLVEAGPASVTAIREILAQNQDQEIPNSGSKGLLPKTLRLALIETLRSVGGPEAVSVLGETLAATKSAEELIQLSRALNQLAPGVYESASTMAARQLLMDNTAMNPEQSRLLYRFLAQHGDSSLSDMAQTGLIGEDGQVNEGALEYLAAVRTDKSIEVLLAAMRKPGLSPDAARPLIASISKFVGANQQAEQAFTDLVRNESIAHDLRFWAIGQLNNIYEHHGIAPEEAPAMAQKRMTLIQGLLPSISDDRLSRELIRMHRELEQMVTGKPNDQNP